MTVRIRSGRTTKKHKCRLKGGPWDKREALLTDGNTLGFRLKGFFGRYVNWTWQNALKPRLKFRDGQWL